MTTAIDTSTELRDAYLTLVQDVVLGTYAPPSGVEAIDPRGGGRLRRALAQALAARGMQLATPYREGPAESGGTWPKHAMTMVGRARLDNVRACVERVVADDIPGDVIETGVWRGGAAIYMRAVLRALGVTDRKMWAADSFEGLPAPDPEKYPIDAAAFAWHEHNNYLGVSLEQVKANFDSLRLLDDQVVFLKGLFKDTLPSLTSERWSVIRLDGDLYESTIQALDALYPNLSRGGWAIIDDYGIPECEAAVTDYRREHGITDPIEVIDADSVFWQRG